MFDGHIFHANTLASLIVLIITLIVYLCLLSGFQCAAWEEKHLSEHSVFRLSGCDHECASARVYVRHCRSLSAPADACARGCVIRGALELYKKSLTVRTIVQTPWFQRCSTTACAARADWTRTLERGREASGSQHPVAAHLPPSLLPPSLFFVRRKGFEHQRPATLPWRQKQLVRDVVKGGTEENPALWYPKNTSGHCWMETTVLWCTYCSALYSPLHF